MSTDPKLEIYLASLDKSLSGISVSERAEIVTEIKSHVLDARERDATQSIESILAALGEPETVANRYLLERGLKPGRPPRHPVVKWLTIGFLGTLGFFFVSLVALIWAFSPVLKIDEKNERLILLGGLIDIDGKAGKLSVGSTTLQGDMDGKKVAGVKTLDAKVKDLRFDFSNGKVEFEPAVGNFLAWECSVQGGTDAFQMTEEKTNVKLDFAKAVGVRCEVKVPANLKLSVEGANGKVLIEKPKAAVVAKLTNGKIGFVPDPAVKYDYDARASIGKIGDFPRNPDPNAVPVKLEVRAGTIDMDAE